MKSLSASERYGWARYVGHQVYYSVVGRDYEQELMPLGVDQGVGAIIWSPLGWGRLTGKIRRGHPLPAESRLHKTAAQGPQIEDEYLYKVIDALDEVAAEEEEPGPVLRRRGTYPRCVRNNASTRRQLSSSASRFQPTFIGPHAASVASRPSCRLM